MMKRGIVSGMAVALLAGLAGVAAAQVQTNRTAAALPVNDVPRWFSVQAPEGMAVLAHSLSTGQPVAQLPAGHKFLAFGASPSIVTLAVGGQIAYLPASTVVEAYPVTQAPRDWVAVGPTLEEQAEKYRKEARAAQKKGLEPLSLKQAKEAKKQQELIKQMPPAAAGFPAGGGGGGREGDGGAI